MTPEQGAIFAGHQVTKVSGSPANVHVPFRGVVDNGEEVDLPALKELIRDFDVLAVVLPIHLKQQLLGVAGETPVIEALTKRELVKQEDGGEDKVVFNFQAWHRVVRIEVVTEPFSL